MISPSSAQIQEVTPELTYITKSEAIESLLWLNHNTRYSFNPVVRGRQRSMEYMRDIVDCTHRRKLMLAGRQVAKSTVEAAESTIECAVYPDYTVMYGTADNKKLNTFSQQKLDPFLTCSPAIQRRLMTGKHVIDNRFTKRFTNGSMMMIRNASREENLRAPSVDSLKFDEIQDMLTDHLFVAEQAMFASQHHKLVSLAGTPKSMQNTIEGYWKISTQCDWMIPCQHCMETTKVGNLVMRDHFWNRIGPKNCSRHGMICARCGKPIHTEDGQWVRMREFGGGISYEGYRVPQPISPFADFDDIMDAIESPHIPTNKVMNEIFGFSWESADRYLLESDLTNACGEMPLYDKLREMPESLQKMLTMRHIVAGIDWSLNLDTGAETVLVIGYVTSDHRLQIFFMKKIPKSLIWPDQVRYIVNKLREFNVSLVCADLGAAGHRNVDIAAAIGRKKMVQIDYSGGATFVESHNERVRAIRLNRTMVLSDFRSDLTKKNGEIFFPKWDDFSPFANDFLVEVVEEDGLGRLKFDHPMGSCDDTLHAAVYVNIARKIVLKASILHLVAQVEEE